MTKLASHRESNHTRRALGDWTQADLARGLYPADLEVVRATEAARSLVLDLFVATAPERDLFSACARLGGLMAEGGASPSLAAGVIDGAVVALGEAGAPFEPDRVASARASLLEGYVAVVRDRERATALASWEYPACVVPIDDGVLGIACGFPPDDAEALAEWAARVTGRLVKAKVRCVRLSGNAPAIAQMESAAALVGITVLPSKAAADRADTTAPPAVTGRTWLRLPWRR